MKVNTDELNRQADQLRYIAYRLSDIEDSVLQISRSLSRERFGERFRMPLWQAARSIDNRSDELRRMTSALNQIARLYERTETGIVDEADHAVIHHPQWITGIIPIPRIIPIPWMPPIPVPHWPGRDRLEDVFHDVIDGDSHDNRPQPWVTPIPDPIRDNNLPNPGDMLEIDRNGNGTSTPDNRPHSWGIPIPDPIRDNNLPSPGEIAQITGDNNNPTAIPDVPNRVSVFEAIIRPEALQPVGPAVNPVPSNPNPISAFEAVIRPEALRPVGPGASVIDWTPWNP